jgi:hypothetical protein
MFAIKTPPLLLLVLRCCCGDGAARTSRCCGAVWRSPMLVIESAAA